MRALHEVKILRFKGLLERVDNILRSSFLQHHVLMVFELIVFAYSPVASWLQREPDNVTFLKDNVVADALSRRRRVSLKQQMIQR